MAFDEAPKQSNELPRSAFGLLVVQKKSDQKFYTAFVITNKAGESIRFISERPANSEKDAKTSIIQIAQMLQLMGLRGPDISNG